MKTLMCRLSLIAGLIRSEEISEDELLAIKRLADEMSDEPPTG